MLFNTFTKIEKNREHNKEGCGLGLTIAKNIANALGGDITVESEVDIGSKFILTLPLDPNNEELLFVTTRTIQQKDSEEAEDLIIEEFELPDKT